MYTQLAFRRFWYSVDVELLVWQRVLIHNRLQTAVDKVKISKLLPLQTTFCLCARPV